MMWVATRKQRRFTEDEPRGRGRAEWDALHRVADAGYAALWPRVLAALQEAGARIDAERVLTALETGNVDAVEALLAPQLEALGSGIEDAVLSLLHETIVDGALASEDALQQVLGDVPPSEIEVIIGRVNEAATDYVRDRSATLVRDVDEVTRRGVRMIIQRGVDEGAPPLQTMRDLEGMIGLTEQQARSVQRYREALEGEGVRGKRLRELVAARVQRFKRQRAEAIARTETIDAATVGQQTLWEQAEQQGIVPANMRRFWIVTPDDRLCRICAPIPRLNRNGVGLHEPFETPVGARMRPTAHPQCRCAISMRRTRG